MTIHRTVEARTAAAELSRTRHDLVTVAAALQTGFSLTRPGHPQRDRGEALVRKSLARLQEIIARLDPQHGAGPEHNVSATSAAVPFDLVLIDDDTLVRETWTVGAEEAGLRLLALDDWACLEPDVVGSATPIFVDLHLGQTRSGRECVRDLARKGFQRLYVTTGDERIGVDDIPDATAIVGKDFPNPGALSGVPTRNEQRSEPCSVGSRTER
jgi:hypothetical protein